jgi:hypothetical protein
MSAKNITERKKLYPSYVKWFAFGNSTLNGENQRFHKAISDIKKQNILLSFHFNCIMSFGPKFDKCKFFINNK